MIILLLMPLGKFFMRYFGHNLYELNLNQNFNFREHKDGNECNVENSRSHHEINIHR